MFYSDEILQRRSGKFGIVWLAATRAAALTKRDYYSVHVIKICDDLLKHINLRVFHHGSKQRFSLYLSSQLMFGIAKVYGKQADYLLIEVQRLHRQFSSTRLMLAECLEDDPYQLPRIPKSLGSHTLQPPDLAQFSGEIHLMSSPHPHFFEEEFISSRSLRELAMSFKSPDRPISPIPELMDLPDIQPHVVSNIDEITLKEDGNLRPTDYQVTDGDDLGGMMVHDLEATLGDVPMPAEDEFMVYGEADQHVTTPPREMWAIDEQTGKVVLSPEQKKKAPTKRTKKAAKPSSPEEAVEPAPAPSPITAPAREKDSSDEGLPEFKTPLSPSGQAVDIPILRLAAIREQEVTPPSGRRSGRKRRRQLLFVDHKTQLSKTEIRTNLADYEDLLEKDILANPFPLPGAKELFSGPARKVAKMSPVFVEVWREGSNAPAIPDDDPDRVWSTEYLREELEMLEGSSSEYDLPEVPKLGTTDLERSEQWRAGEESRVSSKMEDTPASISLADSSRLSQSRAGSRQGSFLPEPRVGRHEDIIEEELVAALQPVIPQTEEFVPPEVPLLMEEGVQVGEDLDLGRAPDQSTSEDEERPRVPHEQILQKISELASQDDITTFQELVPLSTDRKIAAKIFAICLEYAKKGLVALEQSRPFADISIQPLRREEVY